MPICLANIQLIQLRDKDLKAAALHVKPTNMQFATQTSNYI